MTIITHDYKPVRKFNGVYFTLEEISNLPRITKWRKLFTDQGWKTRVLKGKKEGYVSQQYLLYVEKE